MLRTLTIVGLALACALAAAAAGAPAAHAGPPVTAYRGLGAWIDIYDPVSWNNPRAAVERAHRRGVRTLYVETANYHAPSAIYRPDRLATIIHAAHARDMKVVAWYLPGFKDLAKDTRRSLAAIRYRTPRGQRFDSFALDIEASIVKPASLRSSRLVTLSRRLRDKVGPRYPLGAIIPSPVGMTMHSSYWPGFPYKRLTEFYDVIVPMGYFTYHVKGYAKTYDESRENIRLVREETGRADVPIHLIGGLAAQASGNEVKAFVRATREAGIIGASLYDLETSDAADWEQLRNVRTNPRQPVVLPRFDAWELALGRLPGGDRTHPKEVFYETGPVAAGSRLEYQVFDCQRSEVRLLVNWDDLGRLPEGPAGEWSETRTVELPAAVLKQNGRNVIGFVARGSYPAWTTWGVREVQVVAP